ncbi:unnamed protein product [Didymodactylos carnosus]|nr:unnamed protein product [Didymodactylos carnosus]CAF3712790.1 unnamed protein product [Didymodactylos carnosus]
MISRSREKLENLKQQILLSKKTIVEKQLIVKPCDVTNKDEMIKIFNEVYNTYNGIDIVFANAGVSFRDLSLQESFDSAVRNVFNINVNGVINTILPIIDLWKKQVNTNVENNEAIGQLVIISSQAAHAPFVSPIYGSTKECVRALGFDLRHLLVKYKICVNIVSPGPVLSPMLSSSTAGMKSLACTQEQAASYIYHGLKGNPAEIVFPYFTAVMQFAIQYLPDFIQIPIAFYLANGIMKKTKISKVE